MPPPAVWPTAAPPVRPSCKTVVRALWMSVRTDIADLAAFCSFAWFLNRRYLMRTWWELNHIT